MPGKIDYWTVEIPDKPRPEFTYAERRAKLLKLSSEKGHPDLLPKTKLAEDFDVCPATITKDLKALADYISNNIGRESDFIGEVLFKKGLKETAKNGDWDKARRLWDSWEDWLERRGIKKVEPEKHEIEHSGEISIAEEIRKARRILEEKNG